MPFLQLPEYGLDNELLFWGIGVFLWKLISLLSNLSEEINTVSLRVFQTNGM